MRLLGTSIIRASSIVWPPGKWSSRVLPIGSSGPKVRSLPGTWVVGSLVKILRMMSGESIVLPRELAYLLRMASRTLSTKSSSLTSTRVAEAPGLFTHIFLGISGSGACLTTMVGTGGTGGGGEPGVVVPAEEEVSRRRDRDLERRRSLEPMTEPLRLRRRGILILSNPMAAHLFRHQSVSEL